MTGARAARTASAWGFAIVAVAGLAGRTAGGTGAFLRVEQLVAGPAAALGGVGAVLPFGYAFAAGMLSALNPCGVALLPAYLGLYLGSLETGASPAARLGRALAVAGAMSAAFVLTFGLAGVLLTAAGAALAGVLPMVALVLRLG